MSQSPQLVKCPYCHQWPLEKMHGLASHICQKPACKRADDRAAQANLTARNQQTHLTSLYSDGASDSPSTQNFLFPQDGDPLEEEPDKLDPQSGLNPLGPWQYLDVDEAMKLKVGHYVGMKWDKMKANEKERLPFYPWASQEEFDVVEWLSTEGLSQRAIDRFLKLSYVSLLSWVSSSHPFSNSQLIIP